MVWPVKDQVSSYKITLLVLIEEYCRFIYECHRGEREALSEAQERGMMLTLLSLVQSPDMELDVLMKKLETKCTRGFLTNFTERLMNICEFGVGSLMDSVLLLEGNLFEGEENSMGICVPLLEKPSVLGLYVRRLILGFNKLLFNQVTKIQKQFVIYIEEWRKQYQEAFTESDVSDSLKSPHVNWKDKLTEQFSNDSPISSRLNEVIQRHSQRQAEYFIAQQTNLLSHNEAEALPPKQLQERISQVLKSNQHLAEAHFLSYMNSLRVKEYCSAMESLFHYFDRHQTMPIINKNKPIEVEDLNHGCRYAALNLASLHYRFGHRNEALAAVQEAIRMAQYANDNVCLQHALSWLERLGVSQEASNTTYMLDRLVSKSTELNMPYLTSLGIQSFAKHNALSTARPANVFECILKSDIVNCQHSLADLMCTSFAQKAALWNMYGNSEMCLLSSQLMLNLNTSELGIYHNSEAECLALCYLAIVHAQQGEYALSGNILMTANIRFASHTQNAPLWMQCQHELEFKRACYQGNFTVAEQSLEKLYSINSNEANLCACNLHMMKGETTNAFQLIQTLVKQCKSMTVITNPQMYCRLLLLKSELLCSTDNVSEAIEPLLECIMLSKKHYYFHTKTMAIIHLAFAQYLLGIPCKAISLVCSVLHNVFSHGSIYDQARAQYLLVRCKVSASKSESQSERLKVLSGCVPMLNDVLALFRKVEARSQIKDVLYYQARIYHELGYVTERNKCALEFKQLDQLSPSWHSTTVCIL